MAKTAAAQREDFRLGVADDASRNRAPAPVDLEAELGSREAARLLAAIDEADAEFERGELVDAEAVTQELHQILRG